MSLGIIRDQVAKNVFRPGSRFVIEEPRPLTNDDHGKFFFVGGEWGGTFDLPAWADAREDFYFELARTPMVLGRNQYYNDTWPDVGYYGLRPGAPTDYIIGQRGHAQSLMTQPGQGVVSTADFAVTTVRKDASTAGRWLVIEEDDGAIGMLNDQARMSLVNPDQPGNVWIERPGNIFFAVRVRVCDENGEVDPLDRILYEYDQRFSGESFPYADSGGPRLPIFLEFEHVQGPTWSMLDWRVIGYLYGVPAPPYSLEDTNFAKGESMNYGGETGVGLHSVAVSLGEKISFYAGNGRLVPAPGEPMNSWGVHGLFVRMLPGESTPRTWAQAFALGPW